MSHVQPDCLFLKKMALFPSAMLAVTFFIFHKKKETAIDHFNAEILD